MTLREQFEKETGKTILSYGVHTIDNQRFHTLPGMPYIQWLEQQIPIREQAAWDAAREEGAEDEFGIPECQKYQTIEDWRNGK